MVAARSEHRPPAGGRVQHWEFLVCADGLEGPGAAIADLLRLINLLASMRGSRREPLAWQWTDAQGRAARRHAGHGPRARRPDVLVVPGWQARNGPHLNRLVARDRAACARLRTVHGAGGQVLALFTGVALAGEAGLLEGARAVVPWPFIASVLRHAPTLELVAGDAVVEHERVWSVDSPALATEAALALLQATGMAELAEAARAVVLHAPERQRLARAVAADARTRVGPGSLERARRWLEDHLHEPYRLAEVARAAATSERSLLRHFRATFGQTPLAMLHAMRVTRARMLLETSYLSTEAIAERCGWRDAAMLREAFRRATGLTPAAYRARYRLRGARREWGRELG
jgi:transcriptional regulator GlxA family with amidase domain